MGRTKGFKRADVLERAIQVFWKKGYTDTSVQDLEKVTGVNKSGLYSEFNDKQDLFLACLENYLEQSAAGAILSAEPLCWENIENFLIIAQTCKGRKGCFAVNTIREISILPAKVKAMLAENNTKLKAAIVQILITECVSSPSTIADVILAFNFGNCLAQNMEDVTSAKERVHTFLKLLRQQPSSSAHSTSW